MGKKKRKKKDKNIKGRDIHKGQAENQQEILLDEAYISQAENQQEMLVDDVDKEQRRATRLGAIIAIVAIVGALCTFLFKMTINSLNIWSERGIIYWYLQSLFSLALSTSVIIFIDIVWYVISDLKRYNTEASDYKQYDSVSDTRYKYLLNDFKIYIIMLILVVMVSIPLSIIYTEEGERWSSILASCFCAFLGMALLVIWIKDKSREDIKKALFFVGEKIWKWVIVGFLCLAIGVIFVANNKAIINVKYNINGTVEICNTSSENYSGMDIVICNMADEKIYEKSVEKEELLFAKEEKYVNDSVGGKKVAEGILINDEWLHWKYIFDLKEAMSEPGKYYMSIIAHQDGKSALLVNSFLVDEKEYIFAQDHIEKEY